MRAKKRRFMSLETRFGAVQTSPRLIARRHVKHMAPDERRIRRDRRPSYLLFYEGHRHLNDRSAALRR